MKRYSIDELVALLPVPAEDANKYSRGKLMLVSGSKAYPGAACVAAFASQRAGAGYTEVFTDASNKAIIQSYRPSLVVRAWDDLFDNALESFEAQRPCAYAVGPGMDSHDQEAARLALRVLKNAEAPVLIDGGAITALASPKGLRHADKRGQAGLSTVVTPHGGEAVRLAAAGGISSDDPATLSCLIAQCYNVIVVLKGPKTYISNGTDTFEMASGSAALAKAGTGDVLSGIIGAFLAQGMDAFDACVLGTTLHAHAGEMAASLMTPISVVAEDLITCLPGAIQHLLDEVDE